MSQLHSLRQCPQELPTLEYHMTQREKNDVGHSPTLAPLPTRLPLLVILQAMDNVIGESGNGRIPAMALFGNGILYSGVDIGNHNLIWGQVSLIPRLSPHVMSLSRGRRAWE